MGDEPIMASTTKKQSYDEYDITNAADTLVRAETMKLKEKKLYKLALAELKKRKKAIDTIL